MVTERSIARCQVGTVGLGCMNLSHAYGPPPGRREAIQFLHNACEMGVRHFDTASLYGFGANEELLGEAFRDRREHIHIASKCGMTGVDGKRMIDGRPETLLATIEQSLSRLKTDHIELYYLHRWDKSVSIEESVGALSLMVEQGKVGAIGLSEVSARTLRKAHAIHPVAAVQSEYSLWTRNPEISVLNACLELDIAFVAFSPLARGYLCRGSDSIESFADGDIRRGMPRFQQPNAVANHRLFAEFDSLARKAGCTPGQLALNWLLRQGHHIVPIPGTRSVNHLKENLQAADLTIDAEIIIAAGELIHHKSVQGARYQLATQSEIDTEQFPAE